MYVNAIPVQDHGQTLGFVVLVHDLDFVERALDRPGHDVAAVILEPSGASYATVPLPEGFLERLRELTRKYEVILIFDEVVTGFRWSPGGVQALVGVTPDLTTMAKIVAGGMSSVRFWMNGVRP